MRVRVSNRELSELQADLAVCFAYDGDRAPHAIADRALARELAAAMKADPFQGRAGDLLLWNADGRYGARRFLVVGLGKAGGAAGEALRIGAARATKEALRIGARRVALRLPGQDDAAVEMRASTEGAWAGAYQFDRHLTDPARRRSAIRTLELSGHGSATALRKQMRLGELGGRAVRLARDLVNEAPSRMTPRTMARAALREGKAHGLGAKVLGPAELRRLGMSALLSVARGSDEPSQVVHLVYRPGRSRRTGDGPKRARRERVVLVGKGVTFDSGGLNLKPGNSMTTMKCDMAGAAAVLGAMTTLAGVGCRHEVHGLLGLVENMTGGAAYKPGDILDTYSGKTVEVGNTDAEGRLVMCDLLAYAERELRAARVVDVATLTGACVVALGTLASGLFTRHEEMRHGLLAAAAAAGEKLWPLPMYEEYLQWMQKGPADLCNVAGRWGGATTAALFLGEFLSRDLPWAHLDIAGPAFTETELPDAPVGGTGAAVLTLSRWLEAL